MKFLIALLFCTNSFAADNIIVPENSGKMYLRDANGILFPAHISYSTDGSGHLKLINSSDPVDDDLYVPENSGTAFLNAADGKRYPVVINYTTDGNGNIIPIPTAVGSGFVWGTATGTLANQADLQAALDLKANVSLFGLNNPQDIYADIVGGNDTTGVGSYVRPVKTLEKALTLMTDNSKKYLLHLAPGDYSSGPVSIPAFVNVTGLNATINNTVTIVFDAGAEENPTYNNIGAGDITMDLSAANQAIVTLMNGSYGFTRTDTTGGAHFVQVFNSTVTSSSIKGNALIQGSNFISNASVQDGGALLCIGCVVGVGIDAYGTANISFLSSIFAGSITGHIVSLNTPTLTSDAASLGYGGSYTTMTFNKAEKTKYISDDSDYRFVSDAEKTTWNSKQSALGYTAEDSANKSTSVVTDQASNTKYSSVKSIFDWATSAFDTLGAAATAQSNAQTFASNPTNITQDSTHRFDTDAEKSTWNAKQNALGYTAEDSANKSTSVLADQASNSKYSSVKSIYDWATGAFQAVLGYTAENSANKATNLTSPDNIKYPSTLTMTTALALKEDASALLADVQTIAKNNINGKEFWVSKAIGNDSNDCSLFKPCATIQRGINVAEAVAAFYNQAVVHVAPASTSTSYTENLTFSQQGVNLICDVHAGKSDACVVNGTTTVNLTGTAGGTAYIAASNYVYMKGMVLNGSGSTALTFSGTTFQRLFMSDMYIQANSAGGQAINLTNSGITGSTPSTVLAIDSTFENNSSSVPTVAISAGRFWTFGTNSAISNANAAGQSISQTAASSVQCNLTTITGQVSVTDNTANATFNLSTLTSGANSCIVTPSSPSTGIITFGLSTCNSSNTNSFTGSGVMAFAAGSARLGSSGDTIGTITQATIPGFPQGELQVGAGATTGTNVLLSMKNGHIKIAQTTAPTTTLSGNAGTGGTPSCTLANAVDSAGTITLVTGTASWASGTQCTINFNKAHGVAPICIIGEANAQAAASRVALQINSPDAATGNFTINFGVADSAQHTFKWKYHCLETQ